MGGRLRDPFRLIRTSRPAWPSVPQQGDCSKFIPCLLPSWYAPAWLRRCARHLQNRAMGRTKSRPGFGCSRYVPAPLPPGVSFTHSHSHTAQHTWPSVRCQAGLGHSRAFPPGVRFRLYQRTFAVCTIYRARPPGRSSGPELYRTGPHPGAPGSKQPNVHSYAGVGLNRWAVPRVN